MKQKKAQFRYSVADWNHSENSPAIASMVFEMPAEPGRNLSHHDFSGQDLATIDFSADVMSCSLFRGTKLDFSRFCETRLGGVDFRSASLVGSDFSHAWCNGVGNSYTNEACAGEPTSFQNANLERAIFHSSHVEGVDFRASSLKNTKFVSVALSGANLRGAIVGNTVFSDVDLSRVIGLDEVIHEGPSFLDTRTFLRSRGHIKQEFLVGCGVPNVFIEYMASLVAASAIEYYSCFISHSSLDADFAERLHRDLRTNGVRCWFAPEHLRIGENMRSAIDRSIHLHEKLLLILSSRSIGSHWVEKEVEAAFERERREGKTVLFPIRLDNAIMETEEAWAADIRRIRHIGDFSKWRTEGFYEAAFSRLLRDLKPSEGDDIL